MDRTEKVKRAAAASALIALLVALCCFAVVIGMRSAVRGTSGVSARIGGDLSEQAEEMLRANNEYLLDRKSVV